MRHDTDVAKPDVEKTSSEQRKLLRRGLRQLKGVVNTLQKMRHSGDVAKTSYINPNRRIIDQIVEKFVSWWPGLYTSKNLT